MKRVNLDTETDVHRGKITGEYTGRTPCERENTQGERRVKVMKVGVVGLQVKECQRRPAKHRNLERPGTDRPSEPWEGANAANASTWTVSPQSCEAVRFYRLTT